MQITEIRVYIRNEQKLKAFVTMTLENKLVIHNMKIVQGTKGLILCMPSRKGPDGKYRDIVHPISNDLRHEFEQKVFAAYEEEIKGLSAGLKTQSAIAVNAPLSAQQSGPHTTA
ncbi:MAG: SpoVG family protein [Elusimicrobiota bacterium]